MRRWTRRSSWSQPRLRRFARSLPAIWSLARSARWRRTSIGGEFAASCGGARPGGPSAGGAFGGGGPGIWSKNPFFLAGRAYLGGVSHGGEGPLSRSARLGGGGGNCTRPGGGGG